ncbi:MAG: AsmA family protein, partial [Alphaproteobacteria bacterium]|nr:AsmA family protein [Alphaproteobacteria bacterium]
MATVKPPRRGRHLRILLIGLAATLLAGLGAVAWFAASFDANTYKPRIEAAVKRATGRDLTLKGPVGLKLSLRPTIEARDVAFANAPGGSRPAMATLERLEVQIGLLPLLQNRVEIERLVLVRPDILLETDREGRPNWILAREPAAPAPPAEAAPGGARTPATLAIQAVSVRDGILTYRDGRTGHSTTITLEDAAATADDVSGPVRIASRAAFAGNPFTLTGETGPLGRLNDPASRTPWPVRLTLAGAGAKLAVDGTLTEPLAGRGYQATLVADIPDLAALNLFFTHAHLPPLRATSASATIADTGTALPAMRDLALHIGASDLSAVLPGLSVAHATLTSSGLDQPVELAAAGKLGPTPLSIGGTLGPAGLLLRGLSPSPYPVDLALSLADAKASVHGTIADPRRLAGADLTLSAHVADLASISQGLGRQVPDSLANRDRGTLPPIHDLDLKTRLADGPGGFGRSTVLRDLALRVPGADLEGTLTLAYRGRPSLSGTLTAQLIDADRLFAHPPSAAPPSPPPSPPRPPATPPAEPPTPTPAARRAPLFSDAPLPFGVLTLADADLSVTIGALRARGTEYRDILAKLSLRDGKLTLDPLSAGIQDGHLDLRLTADALAE